MAGGSNINIGMDEVCRGRALNAIVAAAQLADHQHGTPTITQQEFDYIQALKARYLDPALPPDVPSIPLDAEYRVAMERLARDYPDDRTCSRCMRTA